MARGWKGTLKMKSIHLRIVATATHCSNDCALMANDAKSCHVFGPLSWDMRRRYHGNRRPEACLKAERTGKPIDGFADPEDTATECFHNTTFP